MYCKPSINNYILNYEYHYSICGYCILYLDMGVQYLWNGNLLSGVVAQWLEQSVYNGQVEGSSPSRPIYLNINGLPIRARPRAVSIWKSGVYKNT